MEELAKFFASAVQSKSGEQKDIPKWGNAISYLREKDFLSEKEEKTLASVYSLLSELHRPIRISEEEMIRFARALALSGCWLLAKKGMYE